MTMASIRNIGVLAAALVTSALLAIASAPWALNQPALNFVFKPLATLIVMAYAWPRGHDTSVVRRWVLTGLCFSLAGDVFLMWPQQGFLPGLVSFLLAHLAYLLAFTRTARFAATPWVFAAYGALAVLILSQLWPGVPGALRIPVVAYVLALASMAAQAAVVWRAKADRGSVLAWGGLLFMSSDALLATNKFGAGLPMASLWILTTYWAAQWCIASWLGPASSPAGERKINHLDR